MNTTIKRKLQILGAICMVAIIGIYAYYRSHDLVHGITIEVTGITDGEKITNPYLVLSGTAKNATMLTLDDRSILMDQNGVWNESLVLSPGYTVVTFKAEDKFGKEREQVFHVVVL